jgi:hypothetical protein
LAFEIHIAQKLFVPPADAARRDPAEVIPTARFLANTNETPFRRIFCNLIERRHSDIARRRRQRPECFDWHKIKMQKYSI